MSSTGEQRCEFWCSVAPPLQGRVKTRARHLAGATPGPQPDAAAGDTAGDTAGPKTARKPEGKVVDADVEIVDDEKK